MRESLLLDFVNLEGDTVFLAAWMFLAQQRMFAGCTPYSLPVALMLLGVEKARAIISSFSKSVKRDLDLPMVEGGEYTTEWVGGDLNTTQKFMKINFKSNFILSDHHI